MKVLIPLLMIGLVSGCMSTAAYDRDQAYSRCESISDKSSRDRCIADEIRRAERERHQQAERLEQFEENAERRALEREKAGVENDG